ncbi:MAG: HPP family protein [Planctomycetota bacterium]|jgi:CBS-domain-containing membrane protein
MAPEDASQPRPKAKHYALQSALAFVFMAGLLAVEEHVILVVSLASTAFMVFARPRAVPAKTRNVIGGHLMGLVLGGVCGAAATYLLPDVIWTEVAMGALAVGLATLGMTVADVEHAPAAGTALAMVLSRGQAHLVAVTIVVGSVFLAGAGRLLRPWLRDLT